MKNYLFRKKKQAKKEKKKQSKMEKKEIDDCISNMTKNIF